jgi:hypothetical protein
MQPTSWIGRAASFLRANRKQITFRHILHWGIQTAFREGFAGASRMAVWELEPSGSLPDDGERPLTPKFVECEGVGFLGTLSFASTIRRD